MGGDGRGWEGITESGKELEGETGHFLADLSYRY